jgi:eukaryotic-like serine/threonine-protein kinase
MSNSPSIVGQHLGHFSIIERIGAGGVGVVYRAHDERLKRDVALKVLAPEVVVNEAARRRFHKEALTLSQLSHPNIAAVYDFDAENGQDFLVMELIPGKTLAHRLSLGLLPEREVILLALQLASALEEAHSHGIIHRDLKPGNIMVTEKGHLKVLDFGLAQLVRISDAASTESVSQFYQVAGTLPYMSPEALTSGVANARSDLWSLGVVLYEMISGKRPFIGETRFGITSAILQDTPARVSPQVSLSLERLVFRCLEKNPAKRFEKASEVHGALQNIQLGQPSPAFVPSNNAPSSRGAPLLEVAHVLFMDIISYSRLPMDVQERVLRILQDSVRESAEFRRAESADVLIRLPTGDGMALVFFGDPEAPVRCALELSQTLRRHPLVQLRMGINTGPVYRVEDINAARNVAGGGINVAQRVMDCGDAGHILVSKSIADVLTQITGWASSLHDLGEFEVKHGVRVHIYNLCTEGVGNPLPPKKLQAMGGRHRSIINVTAISLALIMAVAGAGYWRVHKVNNYRLEPVAGRRSIAVLGFKNLSGRKDVDWVNVSLANTLSTALSGDGQFRVASDENVARVRRDLSLGEAETLAPDTLSLIRRNLGTDLILLGSYLDLGKDGQIQLNLRLQDTTLGDTTAAWTQSGMESDLKELVKNTDAMLRQKCGMDKISAEQSARIVAAIPSGTEAQRFYSMGVAKLHLFDAVASRGLLEKSIAADPENALAHSALSSAWSELGYDKRAVEEAKRAFDLSGRLSDEQRLAMEGRFREAQHDWGKAVSAYRTLFEKYLDNIDYGLNLASVQIAASMPSEAMTTIQRLRGSSSPGRDDPQIDLAEARAAEQVSDFTRLQVVAANAIVKGKSLGAGLLVARALHEEGIAFWRLGKPLESQHNLNEAKTKYAEAGDRNGVATELLYLGHIYRGDGNLTDAMDAYRKSLSIYRDSGSNAGVTVALNGMGLVYRERGDLVKAKAAYQEALGIARLTGNKQNEAKLLGNLGEIASDEGQLSAAEKLHEESVRDYLDIGDRSHTANELNSLASVLSDQGDLEAAKRIYHDALSLARETKDKTHEAAILSAEGELFTDLGDLVAARDNHQAALLIWRDLNNSLDAAYDQACLGRLDLEEGHASNAETLLRSAAATFDSQEDIDHEAMALSFLVRALLAEGKVADARVQSIKARAIASKSQLPRTRLNIVIAGASVDAETGRYGQATLGLEAALAQARDKGYVALEMEAQLALGVIQIRRNPSQARMRLQELEQYARSKGFGLIAQRAQALNLSTLPRKISGLLRCPAMDAVGDLSRKHNHPINTPISA